MRLTTRIALLGVQRYDRATEETETIVSAIGVRDVTIDEDAMAWIDDFGG